MEIESIVYQFQFLLPQEIKFDITDQGQDRREIKT